MYSQVFIMSIMSSWRNRWLFLLSIFCLDNVRTPLPECVKTSPPGKITSRPVHWVKSHFPSFALPMRKTVELAQYQVATIGAPVDLLYHIRSCENPTYHPREAQVIHGE